ncbi:MAG: glycosyltransferase, partial [Planctomycetaceae bacterium]|nr:glycosyltransferase [Planctomycetaceae bacterium]
MDRFRLIVPLFNDAAWLERCLQSIQQQTVTNWTCHVADDGSIDGSLELARAVVGHDSRFEFSANRRRLYQCGTYQRLLRDPSWAGADICVSVDADDYLPDDQVLARVQQAYSDGVTWLTWGNQQWTDGTPSVCGPLDDAAHVRQAPWRTSQLRTWRLFLWRLIRPADFLGPDGQPLRAAGDVASMFAMIEMAGDRHIQFLESINYIYNR